MERAVSSVLEQSFPNWELIVVDDGSEDDTRRVVERLQQGHEAGGQVRYFFQENRGVSSARNRGIREARFSWLAFLDSDDRWRPCKLERQLQAAQQHSRVLIHHTDEIWIRRGRRVNPRKKHRKHGGWIYRRCLPLCVISPSSVMIHRRVFREAGLFDPTFPVCEDYELWLRMACRHRVHFLEEPLVVKYGGHADQLSRSRWGLDAFRVRGLLKILDSGRLTPEQEVWTSAEIARKSRILARGFANRGKSAGARHYRRLAARYREEEQE